MSDAAAPKVQFLFDFGSPNAYLAASVIPDIERRTGVSFEYVPALLGGIYKLTGNARPPTISRASATSANTWSWRPSGSSAATASPASAAIRSFRLTPCN